MVIIANCGHYIRLHVTAQQEFLHSGFGKSPTLVIWGEIEIHTQPWTPWSYTQKEVSNLLVRIVDIRIKIYNKSMYMSKGVRVKPINLGEKLGLERRLVIDD